MQGTFPFLVQNTRIKKPGREKKQMELTCEALYQFSVTPGLKLFIQGSFLGQTVFVDFQKNFDPSILPFSLKGKIHKSVPNAVFEMSLCIFAQKQIGFSRIQFEDQMLSFRNHKESPKSDEG